MATSTVASGETNTSRAIVNWDVAANEWRHVQAGVHTAWLKLNNDFSRS
jgi:hypothetical protein